MYDEDEAGNRVVALRALLLKREMEKAAQHPGPQPAQQPYPMAFSPISADPKDSSILYDEEHAANYERRKNPPALNLK